MVVCRLTKHLQGAAAGFTPQAVCPIVGSWTVPLAPGTGDVCAVFGIGGPGMLAYNTPVEICVLQDSNVRTKTNSLFGEAYFDLSDVTKLPFGLRYDDQSVANNAIACLTEATVELRNFMVNRYWSSNRSI